MKEMKNSKAREGHEDLDVALYGWSSVSLQAPFSSMQTPAQAAATAATPHPNLGPCAVCSSPCQSCQHFEATSSPEMH